MTRFPLELDHFLDKDAAIIGELAQVGGSGAKAKDGAAASQPDHDTKKKKKPKRKPSWKLSGVVDLERHDPRRWDIILNASAPMGSNGVPQGKWLRRELTALRKRDTRCVVETYGSSADMSDRATSIEGIERPPETEGRVAGITAAFREPGTHLIQRNKSGKPSGFHVLLAIPSPPSKYDMPRSGDEAVALSSMFALLRLSTTLFHELLHAWWITTKSKPEDYVISSSDNGDIEQPEETGHGAATWEISPKTLKLKADGDIRDQFRDHVTQFVKETVKRYKLEAKAKKTRDNFSKSTHR